MTKKSSPSEIFLQLLRTANFVVSYSPMQDEPNPKSILEFAGTTSHIVTVSQDPLNNPITTASKLCHAYGEVDVALVLIPGRAFDLTGTRHGRGGGWYDRFLHALPQNWWRVGVTKKKELSKKSLPRQTWDEPMDWLLINDKGVWDARRVSSDRIRMPCDTDHRQDQS